MGATATTTTDRCGDIYMVFEYVDYDCECSDNKYEAGRGG